MFLKLFYVLTLTVVVNINCLQYYESLPNRNIFYHPPEFVFNGIPVGYIPNYHYDYHYHNHNPNYNNFFTPRYNSNPIDPRYNFNYNYNQNPKYNQKCNRNKINEPLILTNIINKNRIEEAKCLSKVEFPNGRNLTSYSGYFTVDSKYNSNLFFWFFPSIETNYKKAPILLWLQGGPGLSSLYALFTEFGQFEIIDNENLKIRSNPWNSKFSVLYIDNPVGAGYSFTDDNNGYPESHVKIGHNLFVALEQFFELFSELKENEFYIGGDSYGGKFAIELAFDILVGKHFNVSVNFNLQGIIIGNGLIDHPNQISVYSDYFYSLHLINEEAREKLKEIQNQIIYNINNNNSVNATVEYHKFWEMFKKFSGYTNIHNFFKPSDVKFTLAIENTNKFLQQKRIQEILHVGNHKFQALQNLLVKEKLYGVLYESSASLIPPLLKNYRFLFYNGKLNLEVPYKSIENCLMKLNIPGFKTTKEIDWRFNNKLAGYYKKVGNLTLVNVWFAGRAIAIDKPEEAYFLINNFIGKEVPFEK